MMKTKETTDLNSAPMSETPARKPRFKRVAVDKIEITDRDIEIIRQVAKHRFLRSSHIVALVGGSSQKTVRRLQLLYHHQMLDRPREQIEYYQTLGSKPMVYGLGNKGADLLAERMEYTRGKINWAAKNKKIGPIFLEHTLLTADFMVALEVACRENGRIRLIDTEEILAKAPESTRKRLNPLGWNVIVNDVDQRRYTLGVIPDKIFGLQYLDKPEGKNIGYFFLEADRATMPVMRASLRQTSFYRKLLAYYATWETGLLAKIFNFEKSFRVLTVTSSSARVTNLIEANKALVKGVGSRIFLFTDEASLKKADNPLTMEWQSGREGETMRLVD